MQARGIGRKTLAAAWGILFLLAAAGCRNLTPVRKTAPAALPPWIADDAVVQARAKEFKEVMAPVETRGVGIYPNAFKNRFATPDMLKIIEAYGFNRIYCYIVSEVTLDDFMREFMIAAAEKGLPVEITLLQRDYFRRFQSNQILRYFIRQYPLLTDMMKKIAEFQKTLPEKARAAGVTLVMEPHIFNTANVERSHRQIYSWDEKNYGIGMDNDMLMREAFDIFKNCSKVPGVPPLTLGVADFYHDRASEGKLSIGKISDCEKVSKKVILISSANKPSQLVDLVDEELRDASGKKTVLIAVPLADHVAIDSGRLRRRNWADFIRAARFAVKKYKQYPAFGGIIVSPLAVVEFLRQEK